MVLKIKDFKNIESADIILDGITVICGENGTGKSNIIKSAGALGLTAFYSNRLIERDIEEAFKRGFHNTFRWGSYTRNDKDDALLMIETDKEVVGVGCSIKGNDFNAPVIHDDFNINLLFYDFKDINHSIVMGHQGNLDFRRIEYKSECLDELLSGINIEKTLSYPELNSGILPFMHIKKLLNYSYLKKGDVILIDDAEKNLHPKWQINFAVVLYEFMKATGVKVLLSTHSPYLVEALEVLDSSAHFYLIDNSKCVDVSEDNWKIYHGMATPLKAMEKGLEAIYESFAMPIEDFTKRINNVN